MELPGESLQRSEGVVANDAFENLARKFKLGHRRRRRRRCRRRRRKSNDRRSWQRVGQDWRPGIQNQLKIN